MAFNVFPGSPGEAARKRPQPTIHVVDNDPATRRTVVQLAGELGYPVEEYTSGTEFLHAWHPHLRGCLVVGLRIPGMSGLAVLKRLGTRGSTLPVIVLTGNGTVRTAVEALRTGAFHFMEQPINDQELFETLQDALREDSLRAQRRQKAERLGIVAHTAEVHRSRAMRKLGVSSLADLVKLTTFAVAEAGVDISVSDPEMELLHKGELEKRC